MSKTYLVTGGTGFIGTAVVKRLVDDGYTVKVLDNDFRGRQDRLADYMDKIECVKADIRDYQAVEDACKGCDGVIHLAYVNGTENFYNIPEIVLEIGIKGMMNVLDACKALGIKELILASTSETYQSPDVFPTPETIKLSVPDPLNPRYSYGGGKIACELLTINYGRKFFDRVLIFRPHNVYGPDMGWEHVVPQFAVRMKDVAEKTDGDSIDFPIQGDGSETRSFVFIDDFVDGFMLMLEKGEHLGIYNIGTEEEITIKQVAELLVTHFNKKLNIIAGEPTPGATKRRCPDTAKLTALGYAPKITLAEGMRKSAEWYDAHADMMPKKQ